MNSTLNMLKYQEYTAWVSVGGQPLETYCVETFPATNEVTCWIASEAGKEFSLHCRDTSAIRLHNLAVYMNIDGQNCGGVVLRNTAESYPNMNDTINMSDVPVSDTTVKQFVFSTVRLTDEDDFADTSSTGLGQIQLELRKVVLGNAILPRAYHFQTEHKVHERSKKAVTHCVGLGKEIVTTRPLFETRFTSQSIAKFTFKYRDPNLLKANGVIQVPAPLKRKASQEIIDLTAHDVKGEGNRSNSLVRGERNSHSIKTGNKNKKVKQEQKASSGLIEVIDLT